MDSCFKSISDEQEIQCCSTYNNIMIFEDLKKQKEDFINMEFDSDTNAKYKEVKKGKNSNKTYSTAHRSNVEAQLEEADTMDDNKILEKYLDKVDQDRRDMEIRLTQDRRESEKRIEEQRRLSEERMESRFNEVMNSWQKTNDKIDITYNRLENKVDSSVKGMEDKLDNTYKWIIGTCIATIIGIAAMVISVIMSK